MCLIDGAADFLRCAPNTPIEGAVALPASGTGHLGETNSGSQWWCTAEEFSEAPQVLRGGGEQDLISRAVQTTQPKPIEPEDALHMRKAHFDFLALPTRLVEGLGVGQRADLITDLLVEIAGDLARDRCRAFGF